MLSGQVTAMVGFTGDIFFLIMGSLNNFAMSFPDEDTEGLAVGLSGRPRDAASAEPQPAIVRLHLLEVVLMH